MMETSIDDFHKSFYVPATQNIVFRLSQVRILGTNHCGNTRHEAFKHRSGKQDVLCRRDFSDIVVASFCTPNTV